MNIKTLCLRRPAQRGVTLIELMVALLLSLFLVTMVGLVYLQTATGTRSGALDTQMNEEGALALDLLQSQLRLAGYSASGKDGRRLLRSLPLFGCDGGFTAASATGLFANLACETGAGNDALAVRYQATLYNSQSIDNAPNPPLPGNCANAGIATTTLGTEVASIADNRYFIANDSANNNAPSLWCRGRDSETSFSNAVALVPNVEQLQLRYAITRVPTVDQIPPHQVTAIVDQTQFAKLQLPAPPDWTRVAAVEVCVVVRSARPAPRGDLALADLVHYVDCSGQANTSATDGRLRRVYRTLVQLPNLRAGVPMPFTADNGVARNPYANLSAEQ